MGRKPVHDRPMTDAERQRRRRDKKRHERAKALAQALGRRQPRPQLAKLARLCGMLGSEHTGERAAAALKVAGEIKRLGLTWGQILAVD